MKKTITNKQITKLLRDSSISGFVKEPERGAILIEANGKLDIERIQLFIREKRVCAQATYVGHNNKRHDQPLFINFTPSEGLMELIKKEISENFLTK